MTLALKGGTEDREVKDDSNDYDDDDADEKHKNLSLNS